MRDLIQEIRAVLGFEESLHGTWFPIDRPPPVDAQVPSNESVDEPAAPPESLPPDPVIEQPLQSTSTATPSNESMATLDLFGNKLDPTQDSSLSPYERVLGLIPEGSPLLEMNTLEEIGTYLKNTVLIPLDETRLNPVLGAGDPEADLIIIGEAPGAEEDKTGKPFTGRAGMLLNKILAAIEFKREEVYITNILKSRPPNNRDPEPYEIEAHFPILMRQISLIKPRLILCVGKTAGNSLLGRRSSLGALRGKFHDFYGLPVIVTYHPAALLRNPQWKRPTWEDVKLLRTRYDELVQS
jgi:DNA polymerase